MEADINAFAMIYCVLLTVILIVINMERPSFNKTFKKIIINHSLLFIISIFLIYQLFNGVLIPPFSQIYIPLTCHFLILIFIPKYNKFSKITFLITFFTIIILSYQYFCLDYNINYTVNTDAANIEIGDTIKTMEFFGIHASVGGSVYFPKIKLIENKILGSYESGWVLDSDIVKEIDKLFKSSDPILKNEELSNCSYQEFLNSFKYNIPEIKIAWHTFLTGIFIKKYKNYELWHNGGKFSSISVELKVRK